MLRGPLICQCAISNTHISAATSSNQHVWFRSRLLVWLQQHSPQEGHSAGRRRSIQTRAAYTQISQNKYDTLLQVGLQLLALMQQWLAPSAITDIYFVLQKGKHWTFDAPEGQVRGMSVLCLTVF